MSHLSEHTDPALKGLRVIVQFTKQELERRRYLLPAATVVKSFIENRAGAQTIFHALQLDGEASFTLKDEPLVGRPRFHRDWLLIRSATGAVEGLVGRRIQSERVDVVFFIKRDECPPCSETFDTDEELLEVGPGFVAMLPEEKRSQTNRVVGTRPKGRILTVAVDEIEWLDLSDRVRLNTVLEIQLSIRPKAILRHWSNRSPKRDLLHLGINVASSTLDSKLVQLNPDSNLFYFFGLARRIKSNRFFHPTWQKEKELRKVLLDCGLPVVFEELRDPEEPSVYVDKEGEFLAGLCFLNGSISYSGHPFRTPLIAKVLAITEMNFVPRFFLLEVELMPNSAQPEIRISYHSEEQESLKGLQLSGYIPPT